MRQLTSVIVLATLCAGLEGTPAFAQSRRAGAAPAASEPRVTAMINGGYQVSTSSFDDSFTFTLYQEKGTTEVAYAAGGGGIFEGGAAIRLWKGLGLGGVISHLSVETAASVRSSVPHPFFLEHHREVTGEPEGLRREEMAIHIQAQYALPAFGRLHVVLAGGPSIIDVKQTAVIDVNYTEEFPYDTATFTGVDTKRAHGTAAGFNAGVDVQWMFNRKLGAGALVRLTKATVDLAIGNRTIRVDAGGTQTAAGIRLTF
jgi:hypothetical protein